MNNKKLQVIILNYNNYGDTIKLVKNLEYQTSISFGITIVDNFSTDNSYSYLSKAFYGSPNINLIASNTNGGYAKGNNLGLKSLIKDHPEYVAILNNDVIIDNDRLFHELIQIYKKLTNPGLLAPVQRDKDGCIYSHSAWKNPDYIHDLLSSFWIYRKLYKGNLYSIQDKDPILKVDLLPGSFLFGEFKFFKKINFFDENTFLFLEERILFAKSKKFGFQNYLITNLNYQHQSSSTIDKEIVLKEKYHILHNSLIYYTRNYRSYGKVKAKILKQFLKFKMAEIKFLQKVSKLNIINRFKNQYR